MSSPWVKFQPSSTPPSDKFWWGVLVVLVLILVLLVLLVTGVKQNMKGEIRALKSHYHPPFPKVVSDEKRFKDLEDKIEQQTAHGYFRAEAKFSYRSLENRIQIVEGAVTELKSLAGMITQVAENTSTNANLTERITKEQ